MKIIQCLAGLMIFLVCSLSFAQDKMDVSENNPTLTAQLDEIVQAFETQRHFMGTVLVAKDGHILFEKAYGMADLEWNVPNTTNAKFRLGSITKQFTATAILQLAEQHKFSLQDKACRYFSHCPKAWKNITIHQLLSHTSGIPSYTDETFWIPQNMRLPKTPAEVLLLTKNKPLEFKPGTQFSYDNSGYTFLGIIIEKVSGEKYADYIQRHIFDPLGMKNSGYDDPVPVMHHRAHGYRLCGKAFCNADYLDMSIPFSAGSLYSTVEDLYRWDRALYTNKILSEKSRQQMFTPVKKHYAYGWMVESMVHHQQIGHGGGISGFSTYIARFPKDDLVVITLSNVETDTSTLTTSLAAKVLGEKVYVPHPMKPIKLSYAEVLPYAGLYKTNESYINVLPKNGYVMIAVQHTKSEKPHFVKAIPFSPTQFYIEPFDAIFTFTPQKNKKPMKIELKQGYFSQVGERISAKTES